MRAARIVVLIRKLRKRRFNGLRERALAKDDTERTTVVVVVKAIVVLPLPPIFINVVVGMPREGCQEWCSFRWVKTWLLL